MWFIHILVCLLYCYTSDCKEINLVSWFRDLSKSNNCTKIRITGHKFPIETGCFENKNQTDRICPLCCEGIGNKLHYLIECKNKAITKARSEFLKPFYNRWKCIKKLSQEEFCRANLACQNDDMITETEILCLKIQETYQNEAV